MKSVEKGQRAPKSTFSLPLRVYYQDTDAGGVVYHSRYLDFLERARYEWLREAGFGLRELAERLKVIFVVRSVEIQFRRPARLDDLLLVTVQPGEVGRSRVPVEQEVKRDHDTLASARVELACVDARTLKPASLPPELRHAIVR
ncbi:MAG: tol-pal system-associated acyl-CoA thioesterase [Azospira oryzae]|nr:MAG: tol-pal system-associated acyl-CoA thioesterase [Azospira oryzae]PZP82767.1 MAG: tol-pal system-associated acyl-CoA thioesterase [Azospira oryzae]